MPVYLSDIIQVVLGPTFFFFYFNSCIQKQIGYFNLSSHSGAGDRRLRSWLSKRLRQKDHKLQTCLSYRMSSR